MKRILLRTLFGLALALAIGIPSSHAEKLDDLLADLLTHNDLIRAFKEKRDAAAFLLRQSQADYYPSVDLNADSGYQAMRREDSADTDFWRSYAKMRATQLVTDFGYTSGAIEKAAVILKRTEHELETVKQQVLIEGITAYIDIVRARERLKYAWQSENNIKKQAQMEDAMVRKGAGLTSDVLQAKAYLARSQALRVRIEGREAASRNRFRTLFKKSLSDEHIRRFELPLAPFDRLPLTLESAMHRAMINNPRIKLEKLDASIAQKELDISKAVNYPRLQLFAEGAMRDNDEGTEGYKNDLAVGAELKFNLYRGGGDRAAIQAALANLSSVGRELADTRYIIEEEVRNAWQQLKTLKETVHVRENQTAIIAEFLERARKERKLGTRSLLDVLNGETTHIQALSDLISAQADHIIATFNLLYALGELSTNEKQAAPIAVSIEPQAVAVTTDAPEGQFDINAKGSQAAVDKPREVEKNVRKETEQLQIMGSFAVEEADAMADSTPPADPLTTQRSSGYPYCVMLGSYKKLEYAKSLLRANSVKGRTSRLAAVDLGAKGTWIRIFEGHFKTFRQAKAYIRKHRLSQATATFTPYANWLGGYSSKDALKKLTKALIQAGFYPYSISESNGLSHLYLGAFYTTANAEKHRQALDDAGFKAKVVKR